MTIAFGTAGAAVANATSAAVAYPASIAAGDLLLLVATAKYSAFTSAPPSGFTLVRERVGGSGGTGADLGDVRTAVWYRIATGSETGSVSVTKTTQTGSVILARMFRYTRNAGYGWSILSTDGTSNTGAASWSAAGANNIYAASGDVVVAVLGANTDAAAFSAEALTATGATFSLTSERQDSGTTTGDDVRLVVAEHACTAGDSTTAPSITATASTGTPDGVTIFVRLRESLGIAADQGSYTVTPQDGAFLRTTVFQVDQGSFALTGFSATLTPGSGDARGWFDSAWVPGAWGLRAWYEPLPSDITMPAALGSFALTGQDAGVLYGRKFLAEQGSLALTGKDAGVFKGYKVTAAQGSYALTGQDAGSSRTYVLAAGQGSHAVTPQNVLHYKGAENGRAWAVDTWYANAWEGTVWADNASPPGVYFMYAGPGYFGSPPTAAKAWLTTAWAAGAWKSGSWSDGQIETGLYKGYKLTAETGNYTYTGDDALRDILLVPDSGSYAQNGQDIGSVTGKFVTAEVGGYVITGQESTLKRGIRMVASFGGYSTSGYDADFPLGVGEYAEPGSYALTGYPATFTRTYAVQGASGSYALTGYSVFLNQGDIINAEAGTYTLAGQDAGLAVGYRLSAETGYYAAGGQLVSPVVEPSRQQGGGTNKRRKYRKRYVVEIDGQEFVVETPEEAESLLEQAQAVAKELLEDAARESVKKKTVAKAPKAPRMRVKGDPGADLTALVAMVAEARNTIRDLYEAARDAEIAYLMRRIQDDDEEDAITALLIN